MPCCRGKLTGWAEKGDFEVLVRQRESGWAELLPTVSWRQVEGAGHCIQRDLTEVVADELRAFARAASRPRP